MIDNTDNNHGWTNEIHFQVLVHLLSIGCSAWKDAVQANAMQYNLDGRKHDKVLRERGGAR
jgi:hypothetical protein